MAARKEGNSRGWIGLYQSAGVYSLADDLGLRWKHNAFVSYSAGNWTTTLTQLYRSGYKNQVLPGVASGTFDPCCDVSRVKAYVTYNLSMSYSGIDHLRLTAGITNLFNTKPPFAVSYDSNYGSGSDWEPRVADPRGRSFNITAEMKLSTRSALKGRYAKHHSGWPAKGWPECLGPAALTCCAITTICLRQGLEQHARLCLDRGR